MKQSLARIAAATASGEAPNDMECSKENRLRQNRARTTLWNTANENYRELAKIKEPMLVADGRDGIVDPLPNSSLIAARIPFAWLAFFEGGHAFLYQSAAKCGATVNVFLNK